MSLEAHTIHSYTSFCLTSLELSAAVLCTVDAPVGLAFDNAAKTYVQQPQTHEVCKSV
jgi:hypothetical protein